MAKPIEIGLLGAGVFASYHAGKISASAHTVFTGLHDPDKMRANQLASTHVVDVFSSYKELFKACDGVVIASPASTHESLVEAALEAGCHVLVEKPLALNGIGALKLAERARASGLVLQVGHQERLVCQGLGLFDLPEAPVSLRMVRAGPPPAKGRAMDVSVIWDLMIHDIDLAHRLCGEAVQVEACTGRCELGPSLDEAAAKLRIGATICHFEASRIASDRRRRLDMVFPSGEISVDFLSKTVTNTTVHQKELSNLVDLVSDPLGSADELFFKACRYGTPPMISGAEAAKAVATAEQVENAALAGTRSGQARMLMRSDPY